MLPPVLERLPQVEVVRCYFEPDGTFPNHEPNPLLEENREFIVAKTREEGAALGVAYDGDADRCFFVDDTGEFVPGDFVDGAARRGDAREEPGGDRALRRARELGRAPHDRARPAARRSSTASGTRSSSTGCARRTRSSRARSRPTTTSATSPRPTPASSRSCSCSSCLDARAELSEILRAVPRPVLHHRRDQHARVADVPLKLQEIKERYASEEAGSRTSTGSRSTSTLALQRAPVEHRASAPPEPRGAARSRDDRRARRARRR